MILDTADIAGEGYSLFFGETIDVMSRLVADGVKVDAIITDPPYGTTACKWDTVIPFEPMWKCIKGIRKEKSAVVLFGSEPFSSALRMSNLKEYKYDWVWDKVTARGHLVAKHRPMQQTECVSVFGGSSYYPQMIARPIDKIEKKKTTECARTEIMGGRRTKEQKPKLYDSWYPKTVLTFSNAGSGRKSIHPTQKPVPLMEYLIKTYTREGDTVLDFTCGSGSTGVACRNTGRTFIGIDNGICERDGMFKGKRWIDVSAWRIESEGVK